MPSWTKFTKTQGFGPTNEQLDGPYNGYPHFNKGYDFGMPVGTPIDSPIDGVVTLAGNAGGWGTAVQIKDSAGNTHNLGHLSSVNVSVGQQITRGQIIGASGHTGASTGPHLSYDVWDSSGKFFDPGGFLGDTSTASGQNLSNPATWNPDDWSQEADQIKDLINALVLKAPELSEYDSPEEWAQALSFWQENLSGLVDTWSTLSKSDEGFIELPDGTLIPSASATPEQRQAARISNENRYRQALNDFNLSEYDLRSKAAQDERDRLQDEFENKMDLFRADIDFDQLNITRAAQEIDRWATGKQEARLRAQLLQDEAEALREWGTSPGKSEFTGTELGGAISRLMQMVGVDPNSVAIKYTGTKHLDVEADLAKLDEAMGVTGAAPTVPSLITNPANKPTAPTLPGGPSVPSLLPPMYNQPESYTTNTTPQTSNATSPTSGAGAGVPVLGLPDVVNNINPPEVFGPRTHIPSNENPRRTVMR